MRAAEFITEKWSAKYKRSINCNNPKGFSQRAHCQGRKKNESLEPSDIHKLADEKKIKWDNDPEFLKLSQQLTGIKHLDDMNQKQLQTLATYLKSHDEKNLDEVKKKKKKKTLAYGYFGYPIGVEVATDGGGDGGGE